MRVVVGLEPGQDPGAVADALRAFGADAVQGPAPSLPDVLTAEVPDGTAVEAIAALDGVRYAEPDQLRGIE
jgi:hypothetical protein